MYIFIPFILSFILAIFDGSMGSFVLLMPFLAISNIIVNTTSKVPKYIKNNFWTIICTAYMLFAFIGNFSFQNHQYHVVFDPSHYIVDYIGTRVFPKDVFDGIIASYKGLVDDNILYHYILCYMNAVAYYCGGVTVYSMTIIQTGFGIMTASLVFKILSNYSRKAFLHSLLYSFFGFLLFYSGVIVRDIIITFFYTWAISIVLKKFSLKGLLTLVLIVSITVGLRIYSGFFLVLIIGYYLYIILCEKNLQKIAIPLIAILILYALSYIVSSIIIKQTSEELALYEEMSAFNSNGGVLSHLQRLPPGIRQVAIMFFSMIKPLPPFSLFIGTESFSNFVLSLILTISFWWWYFVFYITVIGLLYKKKYKLFNYREIYLLLLTLVFLLANMAHPDIRRMMPMLLVIYIVYIRIIEQNNSLQWIMNTKRILFIMYLFLSIMTLI